MLVLFVGYYHFWSSALPGLKFYLIRKAFSTPNQSILIECNPFSLDTYMQEILTIIT